MPDFKKAWESTLAFRNDQYLWWQVAEYSYDTYLIRNRTTRLKPETRSVRRRSSATPEAQTLAGFFHFPRPGRIRYSPQAVSAAGPWAAGRECPLVMSTSEKNTEEHHETPRIHQDRRGWPRRLDGRRRSGDRPVHARDQMAPDLELPEVARYAVGRGRDLLQVCRRGDRRQIPGLRPSRRARSCPACRRSTRSATAPSRCCHTAAYYYVGKDPTFPLFCAVPFGLNARQQNAWFYDGGAQKLMDEFTKKFNVVSLLGGNTGCQMGGWFRKEIKEVGDLNGLKMRIAGLAGNVDGEARRGAAAARRRRHLSGAGKGHRRCGRVGRPVRRREARLLQGRAVLLLPRLVGRRHDQPLHVQHRRSGNELPKNYKAIVTAAAGYANVEETAKYDARNPAALKRLVAGGAQLRPFSQAIMEASLKAANELYAEISSKNPDFKKVYDNMIAFRSRRISLVAGRRIHLRHLHDPLAHAQLIASRQDASKRPRSMLAPGLFSFGILKLFRKIAGSRRPVTGQHKKRAQSSRHAGSRRHHPRGETQMKRRQFLKVAGVGLAASTAVAAPAIAQSMPEIKWRMPTSWPKSLDTLYGGCEYFAKRIARDERRQIPDPGLRGRRNRAWPAGPRRGAERHRRDGQHGAPTITGARTRPSRSAPRCLSASTRVA